jgi:hypothetical protein
LAVWLNHQFVLSAKLTFLGGGVGLGLARAALEEVRIEPDPVPLDLPAPTTPPDATWQALGGTWRSKEGVIEQLDPQYFDQLLVYQNKFSKPKRISLTLSGNGAGLVVGLPNKNTREQGYLIRFSEDGTVLFWGQFVQGGLLGLGNIKIVAQTRQNLRLECAKDCRIFLNDRQLGSLGKLPPSGYLALTTSESSAQFWQLVVDQQTVLPWRFK